MAIVAENEYWKIKVYAPPREHGNVHVISKSDSSIQIKIALESLMLEKLNLITSL